MKDVKPREKMKPTSGGAEAGSQQAALRRPWLWAAGAVIVIACFMLPPVHKKERPTLTASHVASTKGDMKIQPMVSVVPSDPKTTGKWLAFIQAVNLEPSIPTRLDSLKAKADVSSASFQEIDYTYQWKVNDRVVEGTAGGVLNLAPFKKGDLITCIVTPYVSSVMGIAVESPVVAIHGLPPTLGLKDVRQRRKIGEPIELQLVSLAPDSAEVTFSLAPPYVQGMVIDKHLGTISFLPQPDQRGTVRFGAAVEDDNRTNVTNIFTITIQ
jgi:hypothetical protein